MRARYILITAWLAVAIALIACSGSSASAPASSEVASAPTSLTIEGAWARPAVAGAESAAYFTITGAPDQPDSLLEASSPDAMSVELHEVTADASGMMGMHPIDRLDIPAGGTIELKPGSYHLMVMGLTKELAVGGTLELELVFADAGTIVVQAEIKQG
jgi:copper(I)-binding protein